MPLKKLYVPTRFKSFFKRFSCLLFRRHWNFGPCKKAHKNQNLIFKAKFFHLHSNVKTTWCRLIKISKNIAWLRNIPTVCFSPYLCTRILMLNVDWTCGSIILTEILSTLSYLGNSMRWFNQIGTVKMANSYQKSQTVLPNYGMQCVAIPEVILLWIKGKIPNLNNDEVLFFHLVKMKRNMFWTNIERYFDL